MFLFVKYIVDLEEWNRKFRLESWPTQCQTIIYIYEFNKKN